MSNRYFLETGDADRERLTILSRLYNPPALSFLKQQGLCPGMTLLEIGCGTGHMACDLAAYLGPKGKVIALDSSSDQIAIAQETARSQCVTNIEFHVADVLDLDQLAIKYDATYCRWVLEFLPDPMQALQMLYHHLNPGGLLTCEALNILEPGHFSCPHVDAIDMWHEMGPRLFDAHELKGNVSYRLYHLFQQLGCVDITANVSQAVLKTAEDKKVCRLGMATAGPALLARELLFDDALDAMNDKLAEFEASHAISGFFRDIHVVGRKPVN